MSRLSDWLRGIPKSHRHIVDNTVVSYPWFNKLNARFIYRGYETESGQVETVWLFTWDEPLNDVHDVACVGTLRVYDGVWSWEMARMDGGDGGLQIILKVFDNTFTDLFLTWAEAGYRSVSGICQ
jgi:hypothetical protein